jgi:hypothetical protein
MCEGRYYPISGNFREDHMATNLAIDMRLLEEARELAQLRTKKDTVNLALKEFVNRRKQLEITELFGKMDPDPEYDYKKARFR